MILGIYGSGGLGREVLDTAQKINNIAENWEKIVFINDFKKEKVVNGAMELTFDEFKTNFPSNSARIVIAVGEPKARQLLHDKVTSNGYDLHTLIHPSAFVGTETELGSGVIIQYGCFVSCNVKIGDNTLVQPNANVGHDSTIGRDAVISSVVTISGTCKIGDRTYIGVGVPVKENTIIGADSIIGMGSVVLRDIPDNVIALGNPARPMKDNENGRVFK